MRGFAGVWMSEESVGDAGPSNLGYFGGAWSPDGDAILAHGYTGALHLWRRPGTMQNPTLVKIEFTSLADAELYCCLHVQWPCIIFCYPPPCQHLNFLRSYKPSEHVMCKTLRRMMGVFMM